MATKKTASRRSPARSVKKTTRKTAATRRPAAAGKKQPAAKAKKAKAAPARRVVPKVSAQHGKGVQAWAEEKLQGWQQEILYAIQQVIEREAPAAQAVIKWAQPVFELSGPFAYVRGAAQHVTFGFWRGAELHDPHGLLEGDGDRMMHLKVRHPDDVRRPEVAELVRQAALLNTQKGDPSRR